MCENYRHHMCWPIFRDSTCMGTKVQIRQYIIFKHFLKSPFISLTQKVGVSGFRPNKNTCVKGNPTLPCTGET